MMAVSNCQKVGYIAEDTALSYLQKNGLRLLEKNFSRPEFGEIDLIMQEKDGTVVFVEVRFRQHENYANPIESVTLAKQKNIIRTATCFLLEKNWFDKVYCRFDIVGISDNLEQIDWVQNAFSEHNW